MRPTATEEEAIAATIERRNLVDGRSTKGARRKALVWLRRECGAEAFAHGVSEGGRMAALARLERWGRLLDAETGGKMDVEFHEAAGLRQTVFIPSGLPDPTSESARRCVKLMDELKASLS